MINIEEMVKKQVEIEKVKNTLYHNRQLASSSNIANIIMAHEVEMKKLHDEDEESYNIIVEKSNAILDEQFKQSNRYKRRQERSARAEQKKEWDRLEKDINRKHARLIAQRLESQQKSKKNKPQLADMLKEKATKKPRKRSK